MVYENFLKDKYWLVDPIDGTSNFEKNGDEFTVNIALIANGTTKFGIIVHPPSKKIWYSFKKNAYLVENNKVIKLFNKQRDNSYTQTLCSRHLDSSTELFLKINNL